MAEQLTAAASKVTTVEPRLNKLRRDWEILFDIMRFCWIGTSQNGLENEEKLLFNDFINSKESPSPQAYNSVSIFAIYVCCFCDCKVLS